MTRAVIYARISLDRDGTSGAPDRQIEACSEYALRHGWTVHGEPFIDSNASGYKRGVKRSAYDQMLDVVRAGDADVILIWKLDRIQRRIHQYVELEAELDELGAALVSVVDSFDSRIPACRILGHMLAAFAQEESRNTGVRVKAAQERAARNGKPHGGGFRTYGYDREVDDNGKVVPGSELVVNRREAKAIQGMAQALIHGSSLYAVAKDMNERGLRTTQNNEWTPGSVSQLLKSPILGGLRHHDGRLYPGNWQPILDESTRLQVLARLARNRNGRISNATSLLTGIAHCGRCGNRLNKGNSTSGGKIFHKYSCNRVPGSSACGALSISLKPTDEFVSELLLHHLEQPRPREADEDSRLAVVEGELQVVNEARNRLLKAYINAVGMDYDFFLAENDALTQRIDELERAHASLVEGASERIELPVAVRSWWVDATLPKRRELVLSQFEDIVIQPAQRKGGNQFDSNRIEWAWRVRR